MSVHFYTFDERPVLARRYYDEAEEIWPPEMEFVYHDEVCEDYWPRLGEVFPEFQFVAYDAARDAFLAVANTVPLAWSGVDADLPEGVPDTLRRAFADADGGIVATAARCLRASSPRHGRRA